MNTIRYSSGEIVMEGDEVEITYPYLSIVSFALVGNFKKRREKGIVEQMELPEDAKEKEPFKNVIFSTAKDHFTWGFSQKQIKFMSRENPPASTANQDEQVASGQRR
ncbi:hypothetical protein QEH52_18965 [Coraliomargarita sp. SDUM461003]|uniref:Uncharacterized protein n=1 Tax=Thalassobacterium maritimum TaxID=3041265 RepID=A0ABU1AZP0_9BACT|nr:hypothetical protein [Coraliomargarita sp. SDUM461003]MDQ8209608.1 hypothetical protein [Coraliomargarita sp. SDUM461003]